MDRALTDELINAVAPMIYGHLVKIGAEREDAKDIVQDALYKGVLYADSIDPDRVPAWLFKVAIHRYYDLCRKRKRHVEISIDTIVLQDEGTPEKALLDGLSRSHIKQVLDGLSATQKHLLVLKYDQGLSYEEISTLLGLPVATVSSYLHRARQKFRLAYKETE